MKLLLLVSAGGAIGAALRLLTYQAFANAAVARGGPIFPWATLTVNVVGSFLMGLAVVTILERFDGSPELRAFLMAGILGGFTTFSAFSLDAVDLYATRSLEAVAAYIGASVILSIAGLAAGMALARWTLT
ncbi:MAG: fluoride efflux transporter CrcB [Hyphomicrobium sp.]|nr:fluoride efflux transporter CrcB [Hyphomicrobium sp.]PPD07518.1 MAG: fluoride efflux transporter CrcB [Hyphomicrobium sp.]